MFIVSKALLISSATVILFAQGSHLVETLCYGISQCVYSAVTVECCVLYLCCVGVFGMLCKEEGSSPVSLPLLRGGI